MSLPWTLNKGFPHSILLRAQMPVQKSNLFKVNNGNTKTTYEICLNSGLSTVDFEQMNAGWESSRTLACRFSPDFSPWSLSSHVHGDCERQTFHQSYKHIGRLANLLQDKY